MQGVYGRPKYHPVGMEYEGHCQVPETEVGAPLLGRVVGFGNVGAATGTLVEEVGKAEGLGKLGAKDAVGRVGLKVLAVGTRVDVVGRLVVEVSSLGVV